MNLIDEAIASAEEYFRQEQERSFWYGGPPPKPPPKRKPRVNRTSWDITKFRISRCPE